MSDEQSLPWRQAWSLSSSNGGGGNRGIMVGVWWNVVLLVGTLVALPFDHRRILGLNPWIKPLKFEISVIVFLLAVALLLALLTAVPRRRKAAMSWGFGIAMIMENTIIAMQSLRGVRSHMNYSTPFDGAAFGVMGLFIALNTALLVVLLALFLTTRVERPAVEVWGIRLGLVMILLASAEGVRMVVYGAHTVGADDGGPGLPFVNWSTHAGDFRVAHFFALHGLQLLWLAGWWLGRSALRKPVGVAAIWATAVLYAGGVWFLFAQAMAARPFLTLP